MSDLVHVPPPDEARYRPMAPGPFAAISLGTVTASMVLVGILATVLFSGSAALAVMVGGYAALIAVLVRRRRRRLQYLQDNEDAVALLSTGSVVEANRRFDAIAAAAGSDPFFRALATYNRAVGHLRLGEAEAALRLLGAVKRSRWLANPKLPYGALVDVAEAQAWMQLGELDRAEAAARAAHDKISDAKRPMLLATDMALLGRRGRYRDAEALARAAWVGAEGLLTGPPLRAAKMLRAFCLAQVPPDAASDALRRRLLDELRPGIALEFRGLVRSWPSLEGFVRAEGLAATIDGTRQTVR